VSGSLSHVNTLPFRRQHRPAGEFRCSTTRQQQVVFLNGLGVAKDADAALKRRCSTHYKKDLRRNRNYNKVLDNNT
jgi:hypothetical protein